MKPASLSSETRGQAVNEDDSLHALQASHLDPIMIHGARS